MSDSFDNLMNNKIEGGPTKSGPEKPKTGRGRRVLLVLIAVLCVLVLLVCGAAVWGYTLTVNGRNLPNVYVDGVFVGDMTSAETAAALRDAKWDAYEEESLAVTLPAGAGFSVDYLRSGAALSRDAAIAAACAYGHDGDVFSNLWRWLVNHVQPVDVMAGERPLDETYIRSCMDDGLRTLDEKLHGEPWRVDMESGRLYLLKGAGGIEMDTDGLYAAVCGALRRGETALGYTTLKQEIGTPNFEAIYEKLAVEPVDARYTETFDVVPEVVGCSFGVEEAVQIWQAAGVGEQVIIPLTRTQPEITAEQLLSYLYRDLLGAQMTYYYGSTPERINNIRLAASKLDGVILLPGETFSYNDTVGQRTVEAGFQTAKAYSDGQEVDELGGGICQVSSTLYGATLYARMKIISRTNHYFKVGYLDYGLDATVSWRQPDFKFRNDFSFPVKLAAYLNEEEQSLVVEIWGTDFEGITVHLHHVDEPVYDEEYTDVQIGYSVRTYGDLYDADGNYLDTGYINSGVYYFHDEDIEWPPGVEKRLSDAFATPTPAPADPYAF